MRPWRRHFRARLWQAQRFRRGPSPPVILAGSFMLLILAGTMLLKLPVATEAPIDWLEALFTSTSAVTVTGLIVVDTGTRFTPVGQLIILLLIQCGGIGIMTFAALTLLALGHRLGIGEQRVIRDSMNYTRISDIGWLLRRILILVVAVQVGGFVLLALCWVPELGWQRGLYHAFFYTISAFNNSGFALHAESLTPWVHHWGITGVTSVLIILGGLGFTVLAELRRGMRWRHLTVHSKLMLTGSAVLLALTFVLFLLAEWDNPQTLGALPLSAKLSAAWFQAVTPRTAGFNVVDTGGITMVVMLFYIVLMFIGAGTNSTGSGIKVTTFMVLVLATRAFLRGRPLPVVFGRRISSTLVFKALAVSFIAMVVIVAALLALAVTDASQDLGDLLFEVVSAFGTVGLSRGITADLSAAGQIVIVLVMFVGRIGPLTLVFLLARPRKHRIQYPEGEVHIG